MSTVPLSPYGIGGVRGAGVGIGAEPAHRQGGKASTSAHRRCSAALLDADTYRQAVWADLSSDQSFIAEIRSMKGGGASRSGGHQWDNSYGGRGVSGATTSIRSYSAEELEMSDVTASEGIILSIDDLCHEMLLRLDLKSD